jgi:hypothetical protein
VGQAISGEFDSHFRTIKTLRRGWNQFLKNYKVKGFSQVTVNPEYRHAVESLMLGSGLGGLSCNTVCLPLLSLAAPAQNKANRAAYNDSITAYLSEDPAQCNGSLSDSTLYNLPVRSFAEYCGILHDALKVEFNLMVACNFSDGMYQHKKSHFLGVVSPKPFIDIWVIGDLANPTLTATAHHIWGYTSSQYEAHMDHPELVIPPPLEVEGGSDADSADVQLGMEGLVALLIHLGAIADQTRIGANGKRLTGGHSFRIMHIASSTSGALEVASEREARVDFLAQVCARARFDIPRENIKVFMLLNVMDEVHEYHAECARTDLKPVELQSLAPDLLAKVANSMMVRHSSAQTALVFTILPYPHETQDESAAQAYVRRLNTLTSGLPPTILVGNGENVPFIVTSL